MKLGHRLKKITKPLLSSHFVDSVGVAQRVMNGTKVGCNAKNWERAGSMKGTKKVRCLDKMFRLIK